MRSWVAIIGLLTLPSPGLTAEAITEEIRGPVTARLVCDRTTLPFSGDAYVTLLVTGPRRVEVVAAPLLLTEESLQSWHVEPDEFPLIEDAAEGKQTWSKRYRLRPYTLGPKVPIVAAPFTIRVGTMKEFELSFSRPLQIEVTKTIDKEDPTPETELGALIAQAKADKLKPATGAEQLPKVGGRPTNPREQWFVAALVGVVGAITLLGAYLLVRRIKPIAHAELHDTAWALRELARLKEGDIPRPETLQRVSFVLREWVELYRRIPASRFTTLETLAALRESEQGPSDLEELGSLLDACDRGRFTPNCLLEDPASVVDRALDLVRGGPGFPKR